MTAAKDLTERKKQVRGVLLALHVIALCLMAFPAPRGAQRRSAWKDPTSQAEFHAFADALRKVGLDLSDAEFEETLWRLSKGYTKIRNLILTPIRPYTDFTGSRQGWRMFVAPHRYPARLEIEIRERGKWRPIYVGRSEEYTWRRELFDHHRMRKAIFLYAWPHHKRRYRQFVRWVRKEVAKDFPYATRVRVRYFKYRTQSPQEVKEGLPLDGKYIATRTYTLEHQP